MPVFFRVNGHATAIEISANTAAVGAYPNSAGIVFTHSQSRFDRQAVGFIRTRILPFAEEIGIFIDKIDTAAVSSNPHIAEIILKNSPNRSVRQARFPVGSHPILDGGGDGFTQKTFGGYLKDAPDANKLSIIAKRLIKVVKTYDSSRPVTAGLAGVAMSNETEFPYLLDICGYNYTENRYDTDHKKYPKRIIYGSENRHDMAAWKAVRDNEHIFAQFLWTGIDYLGESGEWPSRGFYSGLLDFAGFIKPRGYFRKALWTEKPTIDIGTYPNRNPKWEPSMDAWPIWNYEDGQAIRVVCYTNTEKAQLLLNGKAIGEAKNYDDNTGIIYWDIPYQAGKLEIIGYNEEKEVTRKAIQTSGKPYALTASVEKDNNLAFITLQVVDENGIPVMLSDDEITCEIEGAAELLGLEAGNNSDMGNYRDSKQRVYHGRLLAYIQTREQTGEITVRFSAPWLNPVEVKI